MTKQEITNYRPQEFSYWVRQYLPDSMTGYLISDLDFILYNFKHKKLMFLELKTRGNKIEDWQKNMWRNVNRWIQKGIDDDWEYLGFHLIEFTNTCFKDGGCKFDYIDITEKELQEKLSF